MSERRNLGIGRRKRASGRLLILALMLSAVATLGPTLAQRDDDPEVVDRYGDLVNIFSGDIRVPKNVNRRGMVLSIGGDVVIEGTVREVVVIFGRAEISGRVRGQVVGVLSELEFDRAVVGDQVVNVLGSLEGADDTEIHGQTFNLPLGWWPGLTGLLFWFRALFLFAAFITLLLLAALVPDRIRIIGEEAPVRYVPAFFVGILGWLGFFIVFTLLSATVIGLPLAWFGLYVLKWLGLAGIFYAVGHGLGRAFGGNMSLLGSVLITFTLYAVLRLAPTPLGVFGLVLSSTLWTLFFLLVEVPAVGLVLMTRLGSRAGDVTMPVAASVPVGNPPAAAAAPSGPPVSTPGAPTEAGPSPAGGAATPRPNDDGTPRG